MKLENVMMPHAAGKGPWDITIEDGIVTAVEPTTTPPPAARENAAASTQKKPGVPITPPQPDPPGLLLPALCHPHIHLDKAYILTSSSQEWAQQYADLNPTQGSFEEALALSNDAKGRYTPLDVGKRGGRLIAEAYRHGVTSMRAFVEVDHVTGDFPLDLAIQLKNYFKDYVYVQICVFAQEPLMSTEHGPANLEAFRQALMKYGEYIEAIGTAPYVELDNNSMMQNLHWVAKSAKVMGKHLDLHLDYNLNPWTRKLVMQIPPMLLELGWPQDKTVVIGHCTRLSRGDGRDLQELSQLIKAQNLPIHFVGLPTSDLYMMGRPNTSEGTFTEPHHRPRGTMPIVAMIKDYGLNACLGVNNVGNPFTPYGDGDPLQLASWGVGLYHAGTVPEAVLLYECVSWRACRAIGVSHTAGDAAALWRFMNSPPVPGEVFGARLLVRNENRIPMEGSPTGLSVPTVWRTTIKDVVWCPPPSHLRRIVR
jgi:cytosine/adenosine deaminase-related metal-dependent hydrolase